MCSYSWSYTINKMKNISHRYEVNRSRHEHKCTRYKVSQYDDAYMH